MVTAPWMLPEVHNPPLMTPKHSRASPLIVHTKFR